MTVFSGENILGNENAEFVCRSLMLALLAASPIPLVFFPGSRRLLWSFLQTSLVAVSLISLSLNAITLTWANLGLALGGCGLWASWMLSALSVFRSSNVSMRHLKLCLFSPHTVFLPLQLVALLMVAEKKDGDASGDDDEYNVAEAVAWVVLSLVCGLACFLCSLEEHSAPPPVDSSDILTPATPSSSSSSFKTRVLLLLPALELCLAASSFGRLLFLAQTSTFLSSSSPSSSSSSHLSATVAWAAVFCPAACALVLSTSAAFLSAVLFRSSSMFPQFLAVLLGRGGDDGGPRTAVAAAAAAARTAATQDYSLVSCPASCLLLPFAVHFFITAIPLMAVLACFIFGGGSFQGRY
jgi:hypothetical protein